MKTAIILSALSLATAANSEEPNTISGNNLPSDQLARKAVEAFQQSSGASYARLFPTLNDFYQVMEENATFYGTNLSDAKEEFSRQYEENVLPELNTSFNEILKEGKERGIDWGAIEYLTVEQEQPTDKKFDTVSVTIRFYSQGKEHRLRIEKVLVLHGEWKISQFAKFI